MPTQAHRNDRQADAFPRLTPCTIIGCGATGRHLALQLAACGVPHLTLFDFDTIEELNLGPQGWSASDIGKLKTAALFEDILHLRPDITVEAQHRRWRRPDGHAHGGIVFCCVDTMEARELIWESCKARAEFFCDARMSAEITRIIAHTAEHPIDYASTLFTDDSQLYEVEEIDINSVLDELYLERKKDEISF